MEKTKNDVSSKLRMMGTLVLQLFGNENEKTLRELDEAVRNAEQLDEYEMSMQALEKAAWNTPPSSREWQAFFSTQHKYLICLRRHQKNSRRFGWSPLARRLLLEQFCMRTEKGRDSEFDPMEVLLRKYNVPMSNEPSGAKRQWDELDQRMEAVLDGKW